MRNTRNQFALRNVNENHMRYIGVRELEELVAGGDAVKIYVRQHGKARQLIGAKLLKAVSPVQSGAPTIKKSEMELNAAAKIFPGTQSRTAGLNEYQRISHVNPKTNRVEEEDFIERTEAKVGLWPLVGDDKAIRVGPSMDTTAIYTALGLLRLVRVHQPEKFVGGG
jgi:hypothetical protein